MDELRKCMVDCTSRVFIELDRKTLPIIGSYVKIVFKHGVQTKYLFYEADNWLHIYRFNKYRLALVTFAGSIYFYYGLSKNFHPLDPTTVYNFARFDHSIGLSHFLDEEVANAVLENKIEVHPDNMHYKVVEFLSDFIEYSRSISSREIREAEKNIWPLISCKVLKPIEYFVEDFTGSGRFLVFSIYPRRKTYLTGIGNIPIAPNITEILIRMYKKALQISKAKQTILTETPRIVKKRRENIIRTILGLTYYFL